ncbi:MAG: hypothetical protein M3R15_17200 [Acidobacteriota bacterium]|nr:hypothetical protein [Acidobacteriota bacterium]
MSRPEIVNCGRRFSAEYQPAGRGRPKGSRNRQTILRAYLEAMEPPTAGEVIDAFLEEVFGRRDGRRLARRRRTRRGAIK